MQRLVGYLLNLSEHELPDKPTVWFTPISCEALNIDPETEADALVANIFKFLQKNFGAGGQHGQSMTFEKMPLKAIAVYCVDESIVKSKLSLVYYEESLYAFVSASDGIPDETTMYPWIGALAFAVAQLSSGPPFHEWWAVVGLADPCNGRRPCLEEGKIRIGPLILENADFIYEESRATGSLGAYRIFHWIPMLVKGSSSGHNWEAAEFTALQELHRLCALLTLETNCHWSLKHSPLPLARGNPDLPKETRTGLRQKAISELAVSQPLGPVIDTSRLERIWKRCANDPSLAAPLEAYYQAVSLRTSHPSFALVAFVGAIEEIGKLLVEAPTPERCPTCNKERTSGSTEVFRRALGLVLPEEKVRPVSRNLYKWRSGTAHAGRTFEWEKTFGRVERGDSMLVTATQSMFMARGPMHADELTRALLLRLLDGDATLSTRENPHSTNNDA